MILVDILCALVHQQLSALAHKIIGIVSAKGTPTLAGIPVTYQTCCDAGSCRLKNNPEKLVQKITSLPTTTYPKWQPLLFHAGSALLMECSACAVELPSVMLRPLLSRA